MAKFKPNVLPDVADHPGGFLRDELDARSISPSELAAMMGRPVEDVFAVVSEQTMITDDFAHDLERVLDTSAQGWLNLVTMYNLVLGNGGKPPSDSQPQNVRLSSKSADGLASRTVDSRRTSGDHPC